MKEVFEKIIEKLSNLGWVFADYYPDGTNISRVSKKSISYDEVVEMVRQVDAEYNNGWIPCSERLPNKDEYLKDDGRFIVTDGNRRYQSIFDFYSGKFKAMKEVSPVGWYSMVDDKCVIAWQPLPEPYQPKGGVKRDE